MPELFMRTQRGLTVLISPDLNGLCEWVRVEVALGAVSIGAAVTAKDARALAAILVAAADDLERTQR